MSLVVNSAARISSVLFVNPDVDLAPDPPFRTTVLARVPVTFAFDLDPGAVDQQAERALRTAKGGVDLQGLLTPAEGAEVGRRPVRTDQPQQAFDKPGRLPERHAEQNPHRAAQLPRWIHGINPLPDSCNRAPQHPSPKSS
jgi:hypothetical protein